MMWPDPGFVDFNDQLQGNHPLTATASKARKANERPYAPCGTDADGAAVLGFDPTGNGVPLASSEGSEALPHARREKRGRTTRQSARAQARAAVG
jgi:hypothetical protein